jgi:hypothetical protein
LESESGRLGSVSFTNHYSPWFQMLRPDEFPLPTLTANVKSARGSTPYRYSMNPRVLNEPVLQLL